MSASRRTHRKRHMGMTTMTSKRTMRRFPSIMRGIYISPSHAIADDDTLSSCPIGSRRLDLKSSGAGRVPPLAICRKLGCEACHLFTIPRFLFSTIAIIMTSLLFGISTQQFDGRITLTRPPMMNDETRVIVIL